MKERDSSRGRRSTYDRDVIACARCHRESCDTSEREGAALSDEACRRPLNSRYDVAVTGLTNQLRKENGLDHQAIEPSAEAGENPSAAAAKSEGWMKRFWHRLRRPFVERILHLNDTPHRIAFGVFLGFVIGWTPTMGAQIILYLLAATLLRANRVSGILPVMLTNPITALPIYVFNWKVGRWFLNSAAGVDGAILEEAQRARINQLMEEFSLSNLFSAEFWQHIGPSLKSLGTELIFGCFIVGLACGIVGYAVTYFGVVAYRRRRGLVHHCVPPSPVDAPA